MARAKATALKVFKIAERFTIATLTTSTQTCASKEEANDFPSNVTQCKCYNGACNETVALKHVEQNQNLNCISAKFIGILSPLCLSLLLFHKM